MPQICDNCDRPSCDGRARIYLLLKSGVNATIVSCPRYIHKPLEVGGV